MIKNGRVNAGWSQTQIENMFMMYCLIHEEPFPGYVKKKIIFER